jgi:hypothetical protein
VLIGVWRALCQKSRIQVSCWCRSCICCGGAAAAAITAHLPHHLAGTTQFERRSTATSIPTWDPSQCSRCNSCVLVCLDTLDKLCLKSTPYHTTDWLACMTMRCCCFHCTSAAPSFRHHPV